MRSAKMRKPSERRSSEGGLHFEKRTGKMRFAIKCCPVEICALPKDCAGDRCVEHEDSTTEIRFISMDNSGKICVLHEGYKAKVTGCAELPAAQINLRKNKALKVSFILACLFKNFFKLQPECVEKLA